MQLGLSGGQTGGRLREVTMDREGEQRGRGLRNTHCRGAGRRGGASKEDRGGAPGEGGGTGAVSPGGGLGRQCQALLRSGLGLGGMVAAGGPDLSPVSDEVGPDTRWAGS